VLAVGALRAPALICLLSVPAPCVDSFGLFGLDVLLAEDLLVQVLFKVVNCVFLRAVDFHGHVAEGGVLHQELGQVGKFSRPSNVKEHFKQIFHFNYLLIKSSSSA
jgi:hypothetical protein